MFLALLEDAISRYTVKLHAYALMKNHFHLVVTPSSESSVPRMMQSMTARYAQAFNRLYTRTGGLYEGRYRTAYIDTEAYWLTCVRYVELNPVRAGIVSSPAEYRWSSYAAHASGGCDPLISPHPVYDQLGSSEAERGLRWQALCGEAIEDRELVAIRQALYSPSPVKNPTPDQTVARS
jgi:putative transposase